MCIWVYNHVQTLQSMWRAVHAAAKDVVRYWKVGPGLRVLSFATFVIEDLCHVRYVAKAQSECDMNHFNAR